MALSLFPGLADALLQLARKGPAVSAVAHAGHDPTGTEPVLDVASTGLTFRTNTIFGLKGAVY